MNRWAEEVGGFTISQVIPMIREPEKTEEEKLIEELEKCKQQLRSMLRGDAINFRGQQFVKGQFLYEPPMVKAWDIVGEG